MIAIDRTALHLSSFDRSRLRVRIARLCARANSELSYGCRREYPGALTPFTHDERRFVNYADMDHGVQPYRTFVGAPPTAALLGMVRPARFRTSPYTSWERGFTQARDQCVLLLGSHLTNRLQRVARASHRRTAISHERCVRGRANLFIDHRFSAPPPVRPVSGIWHYWLLLVVIIASLSFLVAIPLGAPLHMLRTASTIFSAALISCSLAALVRSILRLRRVRRKRP